jgi:hypothetical protein
VILGRQPHKNQFGARPQNSLNLIQPKISKYFETGHTRKNPGNGKQPTNERIAAFDAMGFNWTSQEYVTRSFDERIEDLHQYKKTHGHLNVNRNEDNSLYQFCVGARHSLKQFEKDGTRN